MPHFVCKPCKLDSDHHCGHFLRRVLAPSNDFPDSGNPTVVVNGVTVLTLSGPIDYRICLSQQIIQPLPPSFRSTNFLHLALSIVVFPV